METIQQKDIAEIKGYLERIAEALEALALHADPEFTPKSLKLIMRPKKH